MASRAPKSYVARANAYARDVVAGKIDACLRTKQACQRHLDDLKRADTAGFPYKFDKKRAETPCSFIELLPHIKGEWAAALELIRLEDWQCFIVCSIFGWVNAKTGHRRFLEAYLEIARKNAKSTLAAAIGLYMLLA